MLKCSRMGVLAGYRIGWRTPTVPEVTPACLAEAPRNPVCPSAHVAGVISVRGVQRVRYRRPAVGAGVPNGPARPPGNASSRQRRCNGAEGKRQPVHATRLGAFAKCYAATSGTGGTPFVMQHSRLVGQVTWRWGRHVSGKGRRHAQCGATRQ